MSINISEDDISMVDAAKNIGRSAREITELIQCSSGNEASYAAVEAAETMFHSNIQCLSHILTLRKENEEKESDHHEMVEELKEDFASELMTKELKIEEKEKKIMELEKTIIDLRDEMKVLRMGQTLQGVWASLLKPESFPLPEVVRDENGHQHLSLENSASKETNSRPSPNEKNHVASALRMVSTQIAKEVISQAAVGEDGERIKNRQDGFMQKLLEAVWFIEGRVDGELASKAERVRELEGDVAQARGDKELSLLHAAKREEALLRSLEQKDMELEDVYARFIAAHSRVIADGHEGNLATIGATPFKCASPSAFCSPYSESATTLSPHNAQNRVHFSAPISEIKHESEISKVSVTRMVPIVGSETSPQAAYRERSIHSPSSIKKSPSAMSTFKTPSYDHPYHPRLFTRRHRSAVVSPSPTKPCASPATEGGMPSSKAPSSAHSVKRSPSSTILRLNGSVNPHVKRRPTAKLHVPINEDPYRKENNHAVNRPNRAFIVTSKSPIDSNSSDMFLHSANSKSMRDQEEAEQIGISSEELNLRRERATSVGIVMNYGTSMKSLEARATSVYANQVTPPKAQTDSGPFKSTWLNMRAAANAIC